MGGGRPPVRGREPRQSLHGRTCGVPPEGELCPSLAAILLARRLGSGLRSLSLWQTARPPTQNDKAVQRESTSPKVPGSAIFALSVLTLINLVNYVDRYVVSGIIPDLKAQPLGLSDSQIGLLTTAFMLVYSITAPVFGALGDRGSRPRPLAIGVFLWSIATILSGFASNYGHLLAARALVGIGEAAYVAIAPALLSDCFPRSQRGRVTSADLEVDRRKRTTESIRRAAGYCRQNSGDRVRYRRRASGHILRRVGLHVGRSHHRGSVRPVRPTAGAYHGQTDHRHGPVRRSECSHSHLLVQAVEREAQMTTPRAR